MIAISVGARKYNWSFMQSRICSSNRPNTGGRMSPSISPDCLVVQPAGCTAVKAVVVRRPQLGWCGHVSWHFPAGPLGFGERQGIASAGRLVVKNHPCEGGDNPTQKWHIRITAGQTASHPSFSCRDTSLVFSSDNWILIEEPLKWKNRWNNNKQTESSELH